MSVAGTGPRSAAGDVAEAIGGMWRQSSDAPFGFTFDRFEQLVLGVARAHHWGAGETPTAAQQVTFLQTLRVKELLLARACAAGNEQAWESFLTEYRETLYGAAYAITKQDSLGRELADSLYADLYGTATHGGIRHSKLASYSGRGSLAGWLRSVLAQRFVDEYRRTKRTVSLEDQEVELAAAPPETSAVDGPGLERVNEGMQNVLAFLGVEDRFLLRAYYLDQRTLAQIGKLVGMHESTVSRKLTRLIAQLRKQLLKQLRSGGLSRGAAEEALSADVRDLNVDVRKFLQASAELPFQAMTGTAAMTGASATNATAKESSE